MCLGKILYIVRKDFYNIFGGDTVQVEKIKFFLEKKYDLKIDILTTDKFSQNIKNLDYDLYHFWGVALSLDIDKNIKYLKSKNKKIVINTIYWTLTHTFFLNFFISKFLNYSTNILLEKLCIFFNLFIILPISYIVPCYRKKIQNVYGSKKFKESRKFSLLNSNYIIPNSVEEGEVLCKDISIFYDSLIEKIKPIPNAVDIDYINNHKDTGFLSEVKDFVIESAGIEPLKNQLGLIKALYKNKEIPIVFAGAIRDEKYFSMLKALAKKRGNVYFTGKLQPDDLFSLYKRAKVHVLPSFRESPGLSTLESLICGAQIVVSNKNFCPIKYYKFDEYGFICNPYNIKSIKNAVLEAFENPKKLTLSKDYINFFSYENVANMTYEVYNLLKLKEKQC